MHRTVATVTPKSLDGAIAVIQAVAATAAPAAGTAAHATATATPATGADAPAATGAPATTPSCEQVEVRLDALWPTVPEEAAATDTLLQIADAAAQAGIDVVATLRPNRQGGRFDGPEDVRLGLLVAAARAGLAVDVEADHQDMASLLKLFPDKARVVVSDHTLPTAPTRDDGLLRLLRMQDMGCAVEKLAFPAPSFPDRLRALELVHSHAHRTGHPAVTPLGGGAMLRALLALAGNRATYGHAPGQPPAVSGQPGLADIQAVWDHWGLSGQELGDRPDGAPWFAVLGGSLGHSLSPRIHNAALRAADRVERYGALEMPDSIGAMRLLATVAGRLGLRGASVTNPLKLHALQVGNPDDAARRVGASNCIRFTDGACTNTDHTALLRLLAPYERARVAVLGSGGAARAALAAAQRLGMPTTFTSRDPRRAAALRDTIPVPWVPWDERATIDADVWVQATPLGTSRDEPSPLADDALEGAAAVVEMVYASGPTDLQRAAQARRVPVIDGKRLLLEQAVDAYRFWTGQEPDRTIMEAVIPP